MAKGPPPEAKLIISEREGITIVQVDHDLLFDDPVNEKLQAALIELVMKMTRVRVVLDMGPVEVMGSRFLGTMLAVRRRVKRRRGRMVLARMKPEMLESFRVTQLTDLFRCYDRLEDAVASFARAEASMPHVPRVDDVPDPDDDSEPDPAAGPAGEGGGGPRAG
jgi:anti-anti-sigma factor